MDAGFSAINQDPRVQEASPQDTSVQLPMIRIAPVLTKHMKVIFSSNPNELLFLLTHNESVNKICFEIFASTI